MAKRKNVRAAQVHRFHDSVSLWIGTGDSVYLTPADARSLAAALLIAVEDAETRPFVASTCGTKEFSLAPTEESRWLGQP